jgi:hypothetical protein
MKFDGAFSRIARFEDATDHGDHAWLGGARGLMVGLALSLLMLALTAVAVGLALAFPSHAAVKLVGAAWLVVAAGLSAYWRRQRLAAHFDRANSALASGDPDQRSHGLTAMIMNARRGRAEHARVARALAAFLRRPPIDHPDERGRRQVALSLLCDRTLTLSAKAGLDLRGANLAGLRAESAELAGVCLRGADLRGTRLALADLQDADLADALLEGADFTRANLAGTILAAR